MRRRCADPGPCRRHRGASPITPSSRFTGILNRRPYLLVVAAAGAWALLGLWATELLGRGMEPVEVAFWRAAVGGACFVVHMVVTRRPLVRSNLPLQVGLGVFGVAIFYTALPAAVEAGGIGLAWVLLYTAPGFVLIGGWFAGRRPSGASVLLVVMLLVGVALVAGGSDGDHVGLAIAWGIIAGATYALHYLAGRSDHAGDPVVRYAVALAVATFVLVWFVEWSEKETLDWVYIIAIGAVSTYLPFVALGRALETADPARASVVATIEPVLATILAVMVYDERFGPWRILGATLVFIAAALAVRDEPGRIGPPRLRSSS